jgi:hypothetical protein
MIAALALLLALQGDPRIEKVERLVGNVNRPLLWTPLKVTLTSASDFSGDVVARSGFGFSVARGVKIKAGGSEVVLLPAIDPAEVAAGKSTYRMPRAFVRPDLIVLVDARLPYAGDLVTTEKILYQRIAPEDLEKTMSRGLLEAADLILVREPMGTGIVAATREEAEKAVAAAREHPPALEVVDRAIWPLAPQQSWVPTKKDWALYFVTVYAFAAFVALAVLAKRFPRFGLASVAGVAVLGIAGYWVFPRSQMWIVGQAVEVVPPAGEAREHRLWFLQSALEVTAAEINFPRLVKPVFASMAGTDDSFTIRVGEKGCAVEGLRLLPGRPACFGGAEPGAASLRLTDRVTRPLNGAVLASGARMRFIGDLPAGAAVPADVGEGSVPPGTSFDAWKRFVGSDGLFGIVGRDERAAAHVKSSDLVDEHERPAIFIQRFK